MRNVSVEELKIRIKSRLMAKNIENLLESESDCFLKKQWLFLNL